MNIIQNAIVYKVNLPTASQMRQHFEDEPGFLHTPITDADYRSDGFVPNMITGDLVADFAGGDVFNIATGREEEATGGYLLTLRSDEKIIPNSAQKESIADAIAEYTEKHGQAPEKEQEAVIRESVMGQLCEQAFSRTHYTTALYHQESGLLFVNTTSPGKSGRMLDMIVRLAGSVESTTIHVSGVKHGLTTRLENMIEGEVKAPFGTMEADDCVKLKRQLAPGDPVEKITYTGIDLHDAPELLDNMRCGFRVEELGLHHPTGVNFRLNHQFRLKGIDTMDVEPGENDDGAHVYRMQATNDAFCLVKIIQELCDLLGYEPPADQGEAQPGEAESASSDG